jgi:signal transduction histidine kinase
MRPSAVNPSTVTMRLSLRRAGPLVVALLLGAALIVSSALSYRDARTAAAWVAERQGIGLLRRVEGLGRQPGHSHRPDALAAAVEANRALGLTYLRLVDESGRVVAEAGVPLLAGTHPVVGAPTFGHGRVRMIGPVPWPRGHGGPPPRPSPSLVEAPAALLPAAPPGSSRPEPDGRPWPGEPPSSPETDGPGGPPGPAGPGAGGGWRDDARGPPPPTDEVEIEFEPIGWEDAERRALRVLVLSAGTAGLLAVAALISWAGVQRAERTEAELTAQRHLARLGEMSAVLAHEIRNPLAALKGHAQLLAERVSEPTLAARIDRVVTEAVRLEHLTNDLLDFARSAEAELVPVDPQAVLERAVEATAPARIDRATDTDHGQGPSTWPLDAPRMEQVLINLLENALAVTPEAAMVEARVEREGETLVFTIRDRGPGVPTAERSRIFEPFHTTKLSGTGLGLSVARRIVELHRGRIDVRDARGGGAEFRVCLPRPGPGSFDRGQGDGEVEAQVHDPATARPRARVTP